MAEIELRYGSTNYFFEYEPERFAVLTGSPGPAALTDVGLSESLDSTFSGPSFEEAVADGGSVLIVVPDATRRAASGQIVNLLVRRLIAAGTEPFNISAIFATGIHRRVTDAEKDSILTPFIAQRIKTLDHAPREISRLTRLESTASGIPVELDSALFEFDHVVLVGGVTFHYFAGFTGGRKLVCPGLASSRTVAATHKLAFDCERLARREGVGTAMLDGNPVHEAFVEVASRVNISFSVNTIVDDEGLATDVLCGDWIESHREACQRYAERNTISIPERRPLVIASCGGYPHDVNLIQAHKALEAASRACEEGGTIVLLAECAEGLGRDDFLRWFEAGSSRALAERLCEKYQVNGQTAWSLLTMAERFNVRFVSSLYERKVAATGMRPAESLADAIKNAGTQDRGYIIPSASSVLPILPEPPR